MKKINYLLFVAFITTTLFTSCSKKKDDPAPSEPTCTTVISQESLVTTGGSYPGTETRNYYYNANKKLVKITYTYSPSLTYSSYDTITYNVNGEIVDVKNFSVGNLSAQWSQSYNYTSGKITSVTEIGSNSNGAYNRIRTFTYTSGVLSAQSVSYTTGSADANAGPENISSIVFTGGNPTSADLGAAFGGAATIVWDATAPNPYYGLNNNMDILKLFAQNNATSAYSNAAPGTPFFTNTYTYSNGRVATITDSNGGGTRVNTITYVCL